MSTSYDRKQSKDTLFNGGLVGFAVIWVVVAALQVERAGNGATPARADEDVSMPAAGKGLAATPTTAHHPAAKRA
jgi:hypothetical protein